MNNLKWKILGYNKREVDEHLKQVQLAQKSELEELIKETETCQRKIDLLEQEYNTLTDQNTYFSAKPLLEFALRKVESVTENINEDAEEDVSAIQKSAQQISTLFEPARWFWGQKLESQNDFSDLEVEHEHSTIEVAVTVELETKELGSNNIEHEKLGGHAQSQERVRQEIDAVRHKYMLGKIVGKDIVDNTEKVIISKGEKITENVLNLAHKEGKLADLIIHMVLPTQEE